MKKEICYIILGKKKLHYVKLHYVKPHYVKGRLVKKTLGNAALVEFDWQWALRREEKRGDIIGFWHTHPDGTLEPSKRDLKTMQAWISCFGKPLFCVIQNASHETAYLVSSVKHKKWKASWIKKPFAYKIFGRFGVYA